MSRPSARSPARASVRAPARLPLASRLRSGLGRRFGPRRVALILGSPRSGSTLLGAMLGAQSEAVMLGEVNRHARVLRDRRAQGAPERLCDVCEGDCPLWDRAVPRSFGARHFDGIDPRPPAGAEGPGPYEELFAATGARVLVDSSKTAAWARARLEDARDWRRAEPRLILLTRDGRGTVASMRHKSPGRPVAELADRWARLVRAVAEVHERADPARRARVRYEDLVADPDAALRRLCAAIGMRFEPGMAAYWRHEHHPLGGNLGTLSLVADWRHEAGLRGRPARAPRRGRQAIYREAGYAVFDDQRWREELDAADLAAFEARAGDLNRALGYGD